MRRVKKEAVPVPLSLAKPGAASTNSQMKSHKSSNTGRPR
jgi:hypothetical protein